jgi:hypothetical protein
MTVTLTTAELAGVVVVSVGLAATDASALSDLAVAWVARRAGLEPQTVEQWQQTTDD